MIKRDREKFNLLHFFSLSLSPEVCLNDKEINKKRIDAYTSNSVGKT